MGLERRPELTRGRQRRAELRQVDGGQGRGGRWVLQRSVDQRCERPLRQDDGPGGPDAVAAQRRQHGLGVDPERRRIEPVALAVPPRPHRPAHPRQRIAGQRPQQAHHALALDERPPAHQGVERDQDQQGQQHGVDRLAAAHEREGHRRADACAQHDGTPPVATEAAARQAAPREHLVFRQRLPDEQRDQADQPGRHDVEAHHPDVGLFDRRIVYGAEQSLGRALQPEAGDQADHQQQDRRRQQPGARAPPGGRGGLARHGAGAKQGVERGAHAEQRIQRVAPAEQGHLIGAGRRENVEGDGLRVGRHGAAHGQQHDEHDQQKADEHDQRRVAFAQGGGRRGPEARVPEDDAVPGDGQGDDGIQRGLPEDFEPGCAVERPQWLADDGGVAGEERRGDEQADAGRDGAGRARLGREHDGQAEPGQQAGVEQRDREDEPVDQEDAGHGGGPARRRSPTRRDRSSREECRPHPRSSTGCGRRSGLPASARLFHL